MLVFGPDLPQMKPRHCCILGTNDHKFCNASFIYFFELSTDNFLHHVNLLAFCRYKELVKMADFPHFLQ